MSFISKPNGGLFSQGDFTIDPNTSPEMLARKRERLLDTRPQYGNAKYVGAGIGQLLTGIAEGRQNRAMDEFEGGKRSAAGEVFEGRSGGPLSILGMESQTGGAQSGDGFPASLVRTESGGNWNALNDEVGAGGVRGHGGRLQFGQGRLADAASAGVIGEMTPQQFAKAPPEVQQQVEAWHFSDIDKAIDSSGAADMIGQSIGGVPVTRDGLRAVAHLGGSGGMAKFVQSGGKYNPSDSFGTSLLDYLGTHGGGGQAPQNNPQLDRLLQTAQNPWLTKQQRQVVEAEIGQLQGQQQMQQERQMRREDDAYNRQQDQQDPMYQAKLAKLNAPDDVKLHNLFDEQGQPYKARYNAETGEFEKVGHSKAPSGGITITGADGSVTQIGGSAKAPKALTGDEAKNAGFLVRGRDSMAIIDALENEGTDLGAKVKSNLPFGLGNLSQTEDFQKYDQARRDFVNAVLRRESGAVISPEEFANAEIQYFPQPGDGPEVMAQKRQNRQNAVKGFEIGSGKGADHELLKPQPAPSASSVDFSGMGIADIGQVDIGSLDNAGMDALEARMEELGL